MKFLYHINELIRFQKLPRPHRRLVFYSEGRNYWVHLEGLVRAMLAAGDMHLCYISSDPDDPGLVLSHPRYHPFTTDLGWVRNWLFENIDTDVMVLTMPDLHRYQVKRSRYPVHYVYVPHSLVSLHMAYRPGAFDYYDTIFCAGPHHVREVRAMEAVNGTAAKTIVDYGYSRLDMLLADSRGRSQACRPNDSDPVRVLVAPSWGPHSIIETVGDRLVDQLLRAGYHVTLRPHPQTLRLSKPCVDAIVAKHAGNPLFAAEGNVGGRDALHNSDLMISDWSGAAIEYAFSRRRPVIYVDLPKKVNNPCYERLGLEPVEVTLRDVTGAVVHPDRLNALVTVIEACLCNGDLDPDLADRTVFNIGRSDEIGARALQEIMSTAQRPANAR